MATGQSSFFEPPVPASALKHPDLRIQQVLCDAMEPTYRRGRDYVMVLPVDRYQYPSIYVIELCGEPIIRRVERRLDGRYEIMTDRKEYSNHFLTHQEFNDCVLGIVVADIKVRDERMIREVTQ
ncbi:MAG: hypothetical protein GC208_09760 [Alphaproteobacteria bacterium]|nr:hypothetical protein [Alphaproteobacteria bacterium]